MNSHCGGVARGATRVVLDNGRREGTSLVRRSCSGAHMDRFSRRKRTVELFSRVPNWTAAAVGPFLLSLKHWKRQGRSRTMEQALLRLISSTVSGSIATFAEHAARENMANRTHIMQQLHFYARRVMGQHHMTQRMVLGYAARPQPLAQVDALAYLANTLRVIRRKDGTKRGRVAGQRAVQDTSAPNSTGASDKDGLHRGAVGTFPLTLAGQLPEPPVFTAARAWKARANQGYDDATTFGVGTSTTPSSTFHRWLHSWPHELDRSSAGARRTQEAAQWSLASTLTLGETVAIRWGALREAQQRSTTQGKPRLGATDLAGFIWRARIPTLGTSRSNHVVLARVNTANVVETRKCSSEELASAMGIPLQHAVRAGLRAVTENQAISLVGQGVEMGCAVTALANGLRRANMTDTMEPITYGAAACGLDLTAVAMESLRPHMRYVFAVEAMAIPSRAHRAGWARHQPRYFTLAHDQTQITHMPHVQVWVWTGRCNPYTKWSRRSPLEKAAAKQRAAEEMHAAFGYVRMHKPRVVVGENVAALGSGGEGQVWRTFLAILHDAGEYEWAWQVLNPVQVHGDAAINRSRFWYVGVLCSPAPS